mgnify:CR=1 FL=1|tara:strand:- start:68 stop:448 length:381 start_codon:yes stop_codon:yes gene_type:complete
MNIIYFIFWLSIAAISCIDLYWAIRIRESLLQLELNPIGIFLLKAGGIELFMALKMFGTILVLFILYFLYMNNRKLAWCVTTVLFILQGMLCYHLFHVNSEPFIIKKTKYYRQTKELEVKSYIKEQ